MVTGNVVCMWHTLKRKETVSYFTAFLLGCDRMLNKTAAFGQKELSDAGPVGDMAHRAALATGPGVDPQREGLCPSMWCSKPSCRDPDAYDNVKCISFTSTASSSSA